MKFTTKCIFPIVNKNKITENIMTKETQIIDS